MATYLIAFILAVLVCGLVGVGVAEVCEARVRSHGFWLGFLLGPIGWIITGLLPRRDASLNSDPNRESIDKRTIELLSDIRDDLKWQRSQREKEIVRAKAAMQTKPKA